MKKITLALFIAFCIWQGTRPRNLAILQGFIGMARDAKSEIRSAVVEKPIEQAKADFRREAEKTIREREEARVKQINNAIESVEHE